MLMNWMLMMVIENPMQFMIVSAEPLDSSAAFCATRVENSGESAITTSPQNNKKMIKTGGEAFKINNAETKQHNPESARARVAMLFGP
jgi:hypothetical protein